MATQTVTKKIVKDNDIAYTDKIFIAPLSVTDIVNSELVTPEATEELEYEDEFCVQSEEEDTPGGSGAQSGNGIDLFVDEYPRLPEGYSPYPDSYYMKMPSGMVKQDVNYIASGNPPVRPQA